jgi:hypothetical protein
MSTKTEAALAPLIAQLQARDDALYQQVIEFAGSGLAPDQANALIGIVRNSQASIDLKAELMVLAASLLQPVTIN